MWAGSISIEHILTLEETFATLTEAGWVIPEWLQWLRARVEEQVARGGLNREY
jgi:hypothetical protein